MSSDDMHIVSVSNEAPCLGEKHAKTRFADLFLRFVAKINLDKL